MTGDAVAFLALGISGLSLYYSRFDKRPRLNVSVSNLKPEPETDSEWGPDLPEEIFFLDISNPGEKRVKVTSVVLNWGKNFFSYPEFRGDPKKRPPFALPPGDNLGFSTVTEDLIEWLYTRGARGDTRIRAVVWDALGKRHRSRPIRLKVGKTRS